MRGFIDMDIEKTFSSYRHAIWALKEFFKINRFPSIHTQDIKMILGRLEFGSMTLARAYCTLLPSNSSFSSSKPPSKNEFVKLYEEGIC